MTNIKKELRKSAQKIMPTNELKNKIKSQLGLGNNLNIVEAEGATVAKAKIFVKSNRLAIGVVAAIAVFIIAFVGIICGLGTSQSPISDSVLSLDMNANIQIVTTKDEIILEVEPLDKNGVLLLYGLPQIVGKNIVDGCGILIAEGQKLGYIDKTESVGVVALNDNFDKEASVSKQVKSAIEALGHSVKSPEYKISKFAANLKKLTPNKLAMAKQSESYGQLKIDAINKLDNKGLSKASKNFNIKSVKKAEKKINDAMRQGNLENLRKAVKSLELLKSDIENLLDAVEDSKENVKNHIKNFNEKNPNYAYEISELPFDEDKFEQHFDAIEDEISEQIDMLEENYEKEYENVKKQIKGQFENDDDEEDDD